MKIALASDLHLEFGPLEVQNTEGADVLMLAGDILVIEDLYQYARLTELILDSNSNTAIKYDRYRSFFASASREFKRVLWIPGNHEHYHGNTIHSRGIVNNFLRQEGFHNVTFLDVESVDIDGFKVVGGTLWTDLDKGNPIVMNAVMDGMNDFRLIRDGVIPLSPSATIRYHNDMLGAIQTALDTSEKVIVLGHHAPSRMSIHPRFMRPGFNLLNPAYSSELENFILRNPKIKLWMHGHVHDNFDYMVGSTRVVCNPRGYVGYEVPADKFKLQYIDV